MLSENKKALVCAKLKSIVSSHFSAYNHAVEDSRAEYLRTFPVGSSPRIIPLYGSFYTQAAYDGFKRDCENATAQAREVFENIRKDITADVVKAPSTDAVNMLTLLKMRTPTAQECYDLLEKYGDNVQVYRTLKDIAYQHKIYLPEHPAIREAEAVESAERSTLSMLSMKHANSGMSAGEVSFYNVLMDSAFDQQTGTEEAEAY